VKDINGVFPMDINDYFSSLTSDDSASMGFYNDKYDINHLKQLDKRELYEFLIKKPNLLINRDVRTLVMEDKNYYCFVWLVQNLGSDLFKYFIDYEMIKLIINDERKIDKISVILQTSHVINFLNEEILKIIFSNNDLLDNLYYLDEDSTNKVFEYMLSNNEISFFGCLPIKFQKKLLSKNIFKILSLELNSNFFRRLDGEIISFLCGFEKIKNYVLNSNLDFIDSLVNKGCIFNKEIFDNLQFKNKYLDIFNPIEYRFYMMNLTKRNDLAASLIEDARDKIYDEIYADYSFDNLNDLTEKIVSRKNSGESYINLVGNELFLKIEMNLSCSFLFISLGFVNNTFLSNYLKIIKFI